METETTFGGRTARFGRGMAKVMVAAVVALVVVSAGLHIASAKPYSAGNMSKGGFVAACQGVEGKVSTKGTVVKCSFPNGTSESCNFKRVPVICNYIPLVTGLADTHGPIGGGVLDGGTGTGDAGPHTGTADTSGGGVLSTDDDQR